MSDNNHILVWSYCHPVDISPTLKGIISFLQNGNFDFSIATDYSVDQNNFDKPIDVLKLTTFQPCKLPRLVRRIPGWRLFLKPVVDLLNAIKEKFFVAKMGSLMAGQFAECERIICIEAIALRKLQQFKIPPKRVVYISLESAQVLALFNKHSIHKYVEACSKVVIQSAVRGEKLSAHYGIHPTYVYVPVACHPVAAPALARAPAKGKIRFVYSGYFATWAMVLEIIESFGALTEKGIDAELVLHGHHGGTDAYFSKVCKAAEGRKSITIRDDYFSDVEHLAFLREFDVGIALYKEESSLINWQDLLYSSGKIATYLWAGLPVITNVLFEDVADCPFIGWSLSQGDGFMKAYERVKKNARELREFALKSANENYNLFRTFAAALST